jgi:chromosome segregation ATPase
MSKDKKVAAPAAGAYTGISSRKLADLKAKKEAERSELQAEFEALKGKWEAWAKKAQAQFDAEAKKANDKGAEILNKMAKLSAQLDMIESEMGDEAPAAAPAAPAAADDEPSELGSMED